MTRDANVARIAGALRDPQAARWSRAPGRVNLMGDHTDYNEGFVLPAAVDLECVIAAEAGPHDRVRVRSLDVPSEEASVDVAADGTDEPGAAEPKWGRYVAGVVRALAELGRAPVGLDAVLASAVPTGSGLSSSAAFEVACALALCDVAEFAPPVQELALACQRAERLATGVPSGIMDQLSSLAGEDGAALLIDCRTLSVGHVPLPVGVAMLVVHSGLPRTLERSAYAERRAACEQLAAELGLPALRDATLEQVRDSPLGRHVVTENARVPETARVLEAGDLESLGELFTASHASLRDDYRVSTPELDVLVEALAEAGALGARLTGAGFGGAVVALCERACARSIADAATERYGLETGLEPTAFECSAVAGAGRLIPAAK